MFVNATCIFCLSATLISVNFPLSLLQYEEEEEGEDGEPRKKKGGRKKPAKKSIFDVSSHVDSVH